MNMFNFFAHVKMDSCLRRNDKENVHTTVSFLRRQESILTHAQQSKERIHYYLSNYNEILWSFLTEAQRAQSPENTVFSVNSVSPWEIKKTYLYLLKENNKEVTYE